MTGKADGSVGGRWLNRGSAAPCFLPFAAEELLEHFVDTGRRGDDPLRHLAAWRARIAAAELKRESDPAFLDRDETLWTAGALLAVHRHPDARDRWRRILTQVLGDTPPIDEPLGWDELLGDRMRLFFEVGLPSPPAYSAWLREHLDTRHPLAAQRAASAASALAARGPNAPRRDAAQSRDRLRRPFRGQGPLGHRHEDEARRAPQSARPEHRLHGRARRRGRQRSWRSADPSGASSCCSPRSCSAATGRVGSTDI